MNILIIGNVKLLTVSCIKLLYISARHFRFSEKIFFLSVPALGKVRLPGTCETALSVCAPWLWNALPKKSHLVFSLRIFRRLVKTFLFRWAFNLVDGLCFCCFILFLCFTVLFRCFFYFCESPCVQQYAAKRWHINMIIANIL